MAKKAIRPIRIEGQVAYVPLTKGYEAIIDADDVPLVEGFDWHALVQRRRDGLVRAVYAIRSAPQAGGKRRHLWMHRVILSLDEDAYGDHVDGNGLDNRRCNLRPATGTQNRQNLRLAANNTSGIKGVSWAAREQRWRSVIRVNGGYVSLGYYANLDAAAEAYAQASAKLHGEFGRAASALAALAEGTA